MSGARYKTLLGFPGFRSLLLAQFLGAFNDNVFRMVVAMVALNLVAAGGGSKYLSMVGAVFILPYVFFSGYAGHLADVFSKTNVLIVSKSGEILAMALGFFALLSGRIEALLAVLFLMALQSTFFSPAKYGILPEMLAPEDLSRGNGLLEMSTFVAIILGTSFGSFMYAAWKDNLWIIGLILTALAVAGSAASLWIAKVPPSGSAKPFRLNPWAEIGRGVRHLRLDRTLWLTVIGISYFWFLGALLQMDILLFGKEVMQLSDFWIGIMGTFLGLGIAAGSLAAGRLSGSKIELGLVPLGAILMGLFCIVLALSHGSYSWAAVLLAFIGFGGGLFIVPLDALLQQRSSREEKGRLIATNNCLNTIGILSASGALWLLSDGLRVRPDGILLVLGGFTIAGTVYILRIVPEFLIRFSLWLVTHSIYSIRIAGSQNVPLRGPALLVCNHLTFVDALLVGACVQRFIRFMITRPIYEIPWLHWLFRLMKAIPVSDRSPRAIVHSLELARKELLEGHVVCVFAEGAISRTGNLLPFKRGFERIVKGTNVPVIPVYLDGLWGSIFSFNQRRFFWKRPRKIPYPVTVLFGAPIPPSAITAPDLRRRILEMGSEAAQHRRKPRDLLHLRFLRTAKRRWFRLSMADSTGRELSYGKALTGSLLLAQWMRKSLPSDSMVGLLLPSSVGGALANIAVLMAGKIPVNLNFSAGRAAMESAVEQCNIRTVLTSKVFLGRAHVDEMKGMVFLEDILKQIPAARRVLFGAAAFVLPARLIEALLIDRAADPHSLATVIFSSGSTGVPKGIMLSHHNIISNIESFAQIFSFGPRDRILGVLPFFHSFGFTGTLWFPLICGFGVVYHMNPTDARTIGELTFKYKATILISTPTFYGGYVRRCSPDEFASLQYAIAGAEKLHEPVAQSFKEKYGVDLLEGYGCTEMAPVVAVNIPDVDLGFDRHIGFKRGTVGHPIPGVAAKIVDLETGKDLSPGQEGLLLVKGPNRMMGYLGDPEKTAAVFRGDWYVTGDIASIDEDGFIAITDRLSRFSKIGGEMVPHMKLEETVNRILGDHGCAVTAVPDPQRGEQLVVLYAGAELKPQELWEKLNQTDLPKLWLPKRDHLIPVESLPVLGTGKLDLRRVRAVAIEKVSSEQ
jgi:acyl-[acyl-carrier-protein]-phospholipid O-acyltransferase/long-chain-fatty-acid--[acyl-carrier-protein] ligase